MYFRPDMKRVAPKDIEGTFPAMRQVRARDRIAAGRNIFVAIAAIFKFIYSNASCCIGCCIYYYASLHDVFKILIGTGTQVTCGRS
jgi:hypothetical protein